VSVDLINGNFTVVLISLTKISVDAIAQYQTSRLWQSNRPS